MITTPRLLIRRFFEKDLDSLHLMESDPDVMKFTGPGRAQTLEESTINLSRYMKDSRDEHGFFAVELLGTKELIGLLMLKPSDKEEIEFGFMFEKKIWGQGYASEASKALLSWYLNVHTYPQLIAKTYQMNLASNRVLQKMGFNYTETVEGKLKKPLKIYKYPL